MKVKKNNVILIMAPPWDTMMPPLGVAYLASSLKKEGFNVDVIDMNIELFHLVSKKEKKAWDMENYLDWTERKFHEYLIKKYKNYFDAVFKKISESNPLLVGLSVNAGNQYFSEKIAESIKIINPGIKICIGGPISDTKNIWYSQIIKQIDFSLVGESDLILPEIAKRIKEGKSLIGLPGVLIPDKKEKFINWQPVKDLDVISYPTFSEFDLKKYTEKSLPVISSRGCVGRCNFCLDWQYRKLYQVRSAENLVDELEHHVRKYNIRNFNFRDLVINGNLKNLENICDEIIKRKLKISWCAQGIVNSRMSDKLLSKLKKAGLNHIVLGVESCSDKVLEAMNKPYRMSDLKNLLPRIYKAGIVININLIIGYPGETEKEFMETYNFLSQNSKYIKRISSLTPCLLIDPSPLRKNSDKYGIIFRDGETSDFYKWKTKDNTNTYDIRKKRVKKIVKLCEKKGIETQLVNLYDEKSMERKTGLLDNLKNIKNKLNIVLKNTNLKNIDKKKKKRAKKSEIMLINPPPWGVDNPPTSLASLSSYLENRNIKVDILDFNIYVHNKVSDELRYLWHFENKNFWRTDYTYEILKEKINHLINYAVDKIVNSDAEIIGFSVVDPKERITIDIIERVKKRDPSKIIVLGGPACSTLDSRRIFSDRIPDLVDAYVVNEGEKPLYDIIIKHRKGENFEDIPGVILYKNKKFTKLIPQKETLDISKLSFPTYKGFDLSQYTTRSLTVEWSRGCIGNCAFCKIKGLWQGYRYRDPKDIVDELEYHVKKNNIFKFSVTDPTFNGDIKKLEQVCDLIIQKKLNIKWFGQAIPSSKMTLNLLKKMKQSGCYKVEYGFESGSNKVLKNMRKPYTSEIVDETLKRTYEAGIPTFLFIIIGFPGETREDFEMTKDFLERNKAYITAVKSVNMLHLIDDTDVFEKKEKFGIKILDNEARHIHWVSDNGKNTYELRKKRTRELLEHLKKLNIPMLETNLKEGKEKRLKNINKGKKYTFKEFEKEITNIDGTLYHPNPEDILRNKEDTNVESEKNKMSFLKKFFKPKIVDKVLLGIKQSELEHPAYFAWSKKTDYDTSCYTGENNIHMPIAFSRNKKLVTHWRDFANVTCIKFGIPHKYLLNDLIIKIKIYDNSHYQGSNGEFTKLYVSHDFINWIYGGKFKLSGRDKWSVFSFKINKDIVKAENLFIKLDDSDNFKRNKYGKTLSWIKILLE